MTQRTRYFLVGSSMVVMVVWHGLGGVLQRRSAVEFGRPSEFSYMPAESTAVAYADVRAIMGSDFRQKLRQVLPTGQETGQGSSRRSASISSTTSTRSWRGSGQR